MFKKFFILGLISSIGAMSAGILYASFYYGYLFEDMKMVDFSEAISISLIVTASIAVCIGASILSFLIHSFLKNQKIASFTFSLLFALATIASVFIVLKANDPSFQSEDAQIMADYYKGFIMPMLFFPFLSWYTFKPLIFGGK